MKVVMVKPNEAPYETELENKYEALRDAVGGLIECVYLPNHLIAVVNEEGKLDGLPPNRYFHDDVLCGDFFICADNGDGDFRGLTDSEARSAAEQFSKVDKFPENFNHEDYMWMRFYSYDAESDETEEIEL